MRWFTVLSLLVVCCVCLSVAQVSYDDCCLTYVKKLSRNVPRHIVRYTRQETDGGCNIPAIIFVTRKNRVYCTDPAARWVQELMKLVEKRRSKAKYGKRPYKG